MLQYVRSYGVLSNITIDQSKYNLKRSDSVNKVSSNM